MFSSPEAGAGLPDVSGRAPRRRPVWARARRGARSPRRLAGHRALARLGDSRPTAEQRGDVAALDAEKPASLASAADTPVEFLSGRRRPPELARPRARRHTALIDRRTRQVEEIKEERKRRGGAAHGPPTASAAQRVPRAAAQVRGRARRRYDAVESDSDSEAERAEAARRDAARAARGRAARLGPAAGRAPASCRRAHVPAVRDAAQGHARRPERARRRAARPTRPARPRARPRSRRRGQTCPRRGGARSSTAGSRGARGSSTASGT